MAITVTAGMKNTPKNLEFSQFLPAYRGYGNKGYGQGKPG